MAALPDDVWRRASFDASRALHSTFWSRLQAGAALAARAARRAQQNAARAADEEATYAAAAQARDATRASSTSYSCAARRRRAATVWRCSGAGQDACERWVVAVCCLQARSESERRGGQKALSALRRLRRCVAAGYMADACKKSCKLDARGIDPLTSRIHDTVCSVCKASALPLSYAPIFGKSQRVDGVALHFLTPLMQWGPMKTGANGALA